MDDQIKGELRGTTYRDIESFADWLDGYQKKSGSDFDINGGHEIMRTIAMSEIWNAKTVLEGVEHALVRIYSDPDAIKVARSRAENAASLVENLCVALETFEAYVESLRTENEDFRTEQKKETLS